MIVIVIIILILIIYLFKKYLLSKEYFSVVNQHRLYMDLRDYIDGNKIIDATSSTRGLYKISDNCFVDKYSRCVGNKHLCQMYSLNSCIGPTMY
jgi:hypothetical protein